MFSIFRNATYLSELLRVHFPLLLLRGGLHRSEPAAVVSD